MPFTPYKEISMSLPISTTRAAAALPAVNIQPHGHGHKKGSLDSATESGSGTAAQIPVGSTQNLFGSLLSSLEEIIGGQPAQAAQSTAHSAQPASSQAATVAQTAKAPLTTIGSRISLIA
jgi:hypothetical protein